jgi:hypothetical protein
MEPQEKQRYASVTVDTKKTKKAILAQVEINSHAAFDSYFKMAAVKARLAR